MGARNPERELMKQKVAFETHVKLAESALKSAKTTAKKLLIMVTELKGAYFQLVESFHFYKTDVITKECKTEVAFNGKDENQSDNYSHNDTWSDAQMAKYIEITETIEDKIEELSKNEEKPVEAPHVEEKVDILVTEIESEKASLLLSIDAFVEEVNGTDRIAIATASAMEKFSEKLKLRLEILVQRSRKVDDTLRNKVNDFYNMECAKLDSALLRVCSKVEDSPSSPSADIAGLTSNNRPVKEQVYLEKSKPPRYRGDEVEYPEFRRKWLSIVSKANLPEESEVDKLRDSLPNDAKDQLYGVTTMAKCWEILDKRFGDPRIISMKLKSQLKNIKSEGKSDPDRVIHLTIKVRTIVTKLKALNKHDALLHDSEFLSAVYCALPSVDQRKWLEIKKSACHWTDMMIFLDEAYDRATEELSLLSTYKADSEKKGKVVDSKVVPKTFAATVKKSDDADSDDEQAVRRDKARIRSAEFCGKCPVCTQPHTWTRSDGQEWPSDRLLSCKKFNDMGVAARAKAVEKSKGCPRCTSWNHARDKCKMQANSCNKDDSAGVKCKGDHSRLLCGSGNAYCYAARTKFVPEPKKNDTAATDDFDVVNEAADTVPYFQDIPVEGYDVKARTFWDRGSTRVLIRQEFAESLGLVKKKVSYTLEAVGSVSEMTGYIYLISLVDMYGKSHRIWGYSIDRIMLSSVPDMSALESVFPHVPKEAFKAMIEQEVDILIGLNMNHIMPDGGSGVDKSGGISVKRSIFAPGWVVGGVLPDDQVSGDRHMLSTQAATVRCARLHVVPEPPITPDFWECDQLGVKPTPKCDRCRKCQLAGECSESHAQHTLKDQAELDLIRKNTKLVNGEIWVDYPFIKDPACLPNNRASAVRVAEKVWASLKKDNLLPAYNEQVQQILDRKAAVKLSKQELEEYEGPAQYISHHPVLKNSVSTPVRMVTNSSFNNGGKSLNSCMASGPNSLNPMLDVLLRFRCRECAMQYDLKKAYNTLRTGVKERHLRRWVWKFSEDSEWEDYAFDVVHFGDCCAATQLEVGKDLTADAGESIDPEAAQRIKEDTYVDDGVTGGTPEQVSRFIGSKTEDGSFNGTIPQILAKGNFKIKAMTYSGDTDQEEIDKLGGNIFGYEWNVSQDVLGVKFPVNLSRKKRSVRSEPDMTVDDIERLRAVKLTKRNLLGFVNGIGDPLGIGSPWYMKLKLLMKTLYQLEAPLHWDDDIPAGNHDGWVGAMTEALLEGVLHFPRSTRPKNAVGHGPLVVGFGDGGVPGFGGSVYLQWEVECQHGHDCEGDGDYDANLCMSKCRVCPLRGYTVPRSELCGALLVSRLLVCVVTALFKLEECPIGAVMLLDSRCIISSLEMTSSKMLPFFQNRLAEIHENLDLVAKKCDVEKVHWVESELNPADLLTRGTASIRDIGPDSFHQKGPKFLSSPREKWPVSRSFVPVPVPADEVRQKTFFAALKTKVYSDFFAIELVNAVERIANYSNCLNKVHRILARVIRGWSFPHMEKIITNPAALTMAATDPTGSEVDKAKDLLLAHAMIATAKALDEGKLASLLPAKKGLLIVTTGRLGDRSMSRLLGVDCLPILMPDTRVAFLYMYLAHQSESGLSGTTVEHHRSATGTLARSRSYVWIVRGKNLAKQVVNNCNMCKREKRRLEVQQMGMLKEAQLTVCPPWTNVSLDFAGPVKVGGEVQKRITMKCWILVYMDQASRAVCLLLTSGYSTADFLVKHEEFCNRKGIPSRIISDRGTQLVAGSIAVAEKDMPVQAYDWDRVTRENKMSSWEFVPVGCQWRNPTEAMVKILKSSLHHSLPAGRELRYSEMEALLSRVAMSINSRPLALQNVSSTSQQDEDMMPLTPNQLLLGHNTAEKPSMEYSEDNRFSARLAYIQSVHTEWWRRWIEDVLPTLIPCRRWKSQKRNLEVGDVVMMVYKGNMVDDYRLAKVMQVYPDVKGLVRTVQVGYRRKDRREKPEIYKSKPLSLEQVGVQRLALLQAAGEELPTGLEL